MSRGYRHIVVGGGTAGCVLASRLAAADADAAILLVEAGGEDRGSLYRMPMRWFEAFTKPGRGWGDLSEPEPHADGRRIPAPRGKVLGGCSSVNGMMYMRGHAGDYDAWAAQGLSGWDYASVLPYFMRSEDSWRGADAFHGAQGPFAVSGQPDWPQISAALRATAISLGYSATEDFNGMRQEGFGLPDISVDRRGRRVSASSAFLPRARRPANLHLMTGVLCRRVLLEHGRAVGIELERDGQVQQLRCEGEVILCAGAFNSPQLLLLSGIGPVDELRRVGVVPRHDLPGVGRNLQDHASVRAQYRLAAPIGFDRELRLDRLALSALRWQLGAGGTLAEQPIGLQGFVRTAAGAGLPDLQTLMVTTALDAKPWFPGWRAPRGHVLAISNVLLRPRSRGSVSLRSSDPRARPAIRFNLLAEEADRAAFRRYVRFTREFFRHQPASNLIAEEILPGASLAADAGDADIDAYVRAGIVTAMHPTSTCAMGTGPEAVLDAALRVRGLDGLRVADASSMPNIVGGNTSAPVIMIAEKAADLVLQNAKEAMP